MKILINYVKKLIRITKFAFKIALEVESLKDVMQLQAKIMIEWMLINND